MYLAEDFGATTIRGIDKKPRSLPFSFRYCESNDKSLKPRVQVVFNNSEIHANDAGALQLYGDWNFTPREKDKDVSPREIKRMKTFFQNHRVLFCAVWGSLLPEITLHDYFIGLISFDQMLQDFVFYEKCFEALHEIHEVLQLEQYCKDMKLVNLYITFHGKD